MIQKVFKYGNSLAVILPKEFSAEAGVDAGSLVETAMNEGRVVIQPVEVVPKLAPENQEFVDRLYEKRRKVFKALGE